MYFICVLRFYQSNYGGYTQVVSFFKYRQCLIIAPVVLTRIYALIHQVRVYAFGAPTTRLRVWCTPETLASQGGFR